MSLSSAALGLALVVLAPGAAGAAPIVHHFDVAADGTLQTVDGTFQWDNDVALFEFVLGEGVFDFAASTTSSAAGGFDPVMALFWAATPADSLTQYTYIGADGGEYPAVFDDTDAGFDSAVALTLTRAGVYVLALTQTGNFAHEDFSFDWADDSFQCIAGTADGECQGLFGGYDSAFAGSLRVTDLSTAPVPEPGTLTLLGIGLLATRLRRRRHGSMTIR